MREFEVRNKHQFEMKIDKTLKESGKIDENPVNTTKTKSLREQYLGRTPGKDSKTGREVIERMKKEGKIRTDLDGNLEFKASNGKWYSLREADMSHKVDAVTWWNETGRHFGAKSDEVRKWVVLQIICFHHFIV